jgi:hypothetical protein
MRWRPRCTSDRAMPKLNRRDFTKSVGLAALLSPFLSLLGEKPARAAPVGKAKYLLLFYTNGTDPSLWSPRGSSANNIMFSAMTEPLAPLRPNLVLVEKLSSNGTADNHAAPGGLTGQGYSGQNRISIDQFIADGLKAAGVVTPIPSLILGGVKSEQQSSFYRANQPLSPIFTPSAAHAAIFAGVGGSSAPPQSPQRRKRTIQNLDAEIEELSKQLGPNERVKLELHTKSIRVVEARLDNAMPGGTCSPPGVPTNPSQDVLASSIHLDLAINAFACDVTRVAAVEFGHHQGSQISLTEVGNPGNWHNDFIHGDNPRTRLVNLERWLCGQFVAAANKLKSLPAPTGGGTLFDQTLMVWARDMGDAINHNGSDMRFVFSGGAGGYLTTSPGGRYIDGGGDAHQRALISCAAAMGITSYTGFGDPNIARTPLETIGS